MLFSGEFIQTSSSNGESSFINPLDICGVKPSFISKPGDYPPLDLKSLGIQISVPGIGETTIIPINAPTLKTLIEPVPSMALQNLVKVRKTLVEEFKKNVLPKIINLIWQVEPNTPSTMTSMPSFGMIKMEDGGETRDSMYSPSLSPGTPGSPARMGLDRTRSTGSTDEDEELANVPSLQMRIQIIQQRVSNVSYSKYY